MVFILLVLVLVLVFGLAGKRIDWGGEGLCSEVCLVEF